ncbi:hypothetical protein D1007_31992 [Hordeum vulgare]|nr:hypothetical protein D1007_31992 [Hordeum vulgare]
MLMTSLPETLALWSSATGWIFSSSCFMLHARLTNKAAFHRHLELGRGGLGWPVVSPPPLLGRARTAPACNPCRIRPAPAPPSRPPPLSPPPPSVSAPLSSPRPLPSSPLAPAPPPPPALDMHPLPGSPPGSSEAGRLQCGWTVHISAQPPIIIL